MIALAIWLPGFALALHIMRGAWLLPWPSRVAIAAIWFAWVPIAFL